MNDDQTQAELRAASQHRRRHRRMTVVAGAAAVAIAGIAFGVGALASRAPQRVEVASQRLRPTTTTAPPTGAKVGPSASTTAAPTTTTTTTVPSTTSTTTTTVPSTTTTTTVPSTTTTTTVPSTTTTTVPSTASPVAGVDRAIEVYGDCQSPALEPSDIVLTCADAGVSLEDLQWQSWTATSAVGVGTLVYNDCTPDCADGHFHDVPNTTITLTDPVKASNGQLVFSLAQENPLPPGWATGPLHGAPYPLPTRPD